MTVYLVISLPGLPWSAEVLLVIWVPRKVQYADKLRKFGPRKALTSRCQYLAAAYYPLDWIELDWIGLDWVGLGWIGLEWIGLDWIGLDWIGLDEILDWIPAKIHFLLSIWSFCITQTGRPKKVQTPSWMKVITRVGQNHIYIIQYVVGLQK